MSRDADAAADVEALFRAALLCGEHVETELGEFGVRSYERYEGHNPRTGEPVIVPASHTLWLIPSDRFLGDVVPAYRRPLRSIDRERLAFVSFAEDYVGIVERLRKVKVTPVPEDAWHETVPVEAVAWRDVGTFAVFRGPDRDERYRPYIRTTIVFRQSEAIAAALRAALGE